MSKNDQKKPETKQEQPAEQQTEEVKRPMAVNPPTPEERIEALELTVKEQQKAIDILMPAVRKLDRHHFRDLV